jgi:hypothetical protein
MSLNRRSVVKGTAWAVPVVVTATAAPALAASGGPVVSSAIARKCPGQSSQDGSTYWTTVITLTFNQAIDSLIVPEATLNGSAFETPRVEADCNIGNTVWYVFLEHTDSEHGGGVVNYIVDGVTNNVSFFYDNHPLHGYPCTEC